MRINIGSLDRIFRLVFGFVLLAWAIAGGPWWAYLGLVLIATGSFRFCPIYALFRTNSLRQKP